MHGGTHAFCAKEGPARAGVFCVVLCTCLLGTTAIAARRCKFCTQVCIWAFRGGMLLGGPRAGELLYMKLLVWMRHDASINERVNAFPEACKSIVACVRARTRFVLRKVPRAQACFALWSARACSAQRQMSHAGAIVACKCAFGRAAAACFWRAKALLYMKLLVWVR